MLPTTSKDKASGLFYWKSVSRIVSCFFLLWLCHSEAFIAFRTKCFTPPRPCLVSKAQLPLVMNAALPAGLLGVEKDSVEASTLRWCREFVAKLGLCPWAKLSLTSPGAVRIKVVEPRAGRTKQQSATVGVGVSKMERYFGEKWETAFEKQVRAAAAELLDVTGEVEMEQSLSKEKESLVDPNVAIAFIVAAPARVRSEDGEEEVLWSFQDFVNFVHNLEDFFLDEADAYLEINRQGQEGMDRPLGDMITLAGFHPNWTYAPAYLEEAQQDEDPVHFEKRSPYPTISLVLTRVVDAAGEKATSKIAAYNEEVLNKIGVSRLREAFESLYTEKARGSHSDHKNYVHDEEEGVRDRDSGEGL